MEERSDRPARGERALQRRVTHSGIKGARMATRRARARSRGQTLIVFVLTLTTLIAILGLAVDTVRIYNLYAQMLRAAESGALAGVIYMPDNYLTNLTITPDDNAVCRALQEVSKNGYGTFCNPASQPGNLNTLCPSNVSTVEVAVCPVSGLPHDLRVSVTERMDTLFLSAIGLGPTTITATAQAEYIPPVDVALDPGATGGTGSWGTFGECSGASSACLGSGTRNWSGNINGPGELKEQGDPLVTCEEGSSALNPSSAYGSIDTNAGLSTPYTTYTGLPTNHPQYPGATLGQTPPGCVGAGNNGDQQNTFTGPAYWNALSQTPGPQHAGYAFYVNIPTGSATQNLWVWNAPFSPTAPSSCNGRSGGQGQSSYDTFYYYNCAGSTSSPYPYYPNTACNSLAAAPNNSPYTCTDPNLFFSVTYSIYQITGPTDPGGSFVASFTATPYEVNDHGCTDWRPQSTAPIYATMLGGCVTSDCVAKWCPVANQLGDTGPLWSGANLGPGQYRVMAVASDYGDPSNFNAGYGGHSYSLKLCPSGTTQGSVQTCTPATNATVAGWTLSDALFSFPGNGKGQSQITEYPLGYAGPEFAGRILDVELYDEGDLNGTNSSAKGSTVYAVAPPTAATDPCALTSAQLANAGYPSTSFTFPNNERTNSNLLSPLTGIQGASNGDLIYNGLWTDEQIRIPSGYTGGVWTICAIAPQTNDGDVLGIRVQALGQSPEHLV